MNTNTHIKVRVGLSRPNMFELTPQGINWSPDFKQELYDIEEEFRSKIILDINDLVGINWRNSE